MEMIKPNHYAFIKAFGFFDTGVTGNEQAAESIASISAESTQLTASEKSFLDSLAG